MTIRHMVLFHLDVSVAAQDPRVVAACTAEERLGAATGGHDWSFGQCRSDRADGADFAGVGDFASAAELSAFLAHPAHLEAARSWSGLARWSVADLEVAH